jgi:plastocyanin
MIALAVALLVAADTGSVAGTVRLTGARAPRPVAKINKDSAVCGKEAADEAVVVGAEGALANVVVSLKGAKPLRPPGPAANASVDQVGCRYRPHVQAVTVGTSLAVLNNDAVLHNVHAVTAGPSAAVTVFNLAMPFKGQRLPKTLSRPGILKLRCDAGHSWMSAWVHVFEHPYFAVTDDKGAFTIKDVPPGRYTIEYWHEPLGEKGQSAVKMETIEVTAGKVTSADAMLAL